MASEMCLAPQISKTATDWHQCLCIYWLKCSKAIIYRLQFQNQISWSKNIPLQRTPLCGTNNLLLKINALTTVPGRCSRRRLGIILWWWCSCLCCCCRCCLCCWCSDTCCRCRCRCCCCWCWCCSWRCCCWSAFPNRHVGKGELSADGSLIDGHRRQVVGALPCFLALTWKSCKLIKALKISLSP